MLLLALVCSLAAHYLYHAFRLTRGAITACGTILRHIYTNAGPGPPTPAALRAAPRAIRGVLEVSHTVTFSQARYTTSSRRVTRVRLHHLADQDLEAGTDLKSPHAACSHPTIFANMFSDRFSDAAGPPSPGL